MKNYKLNILSLLLGSFTYAQVGLNTPNPPASLDIVSKGNTNATKALEINNSSNAEMITVLDNGYVGIGRPTPIAKLDINNGTSGNAIRIVDGTQGADKVLTSDANGVARWSATSATSLYFLSSSLYVANTTDFRGTTAPVSGAGTGGNIRYVVTGTVTNLGPATTYTSGSKGLSYRVPENGLYRLTFYVDKVPTGSSISMTSFRNGIAQHNNNDIGNNLSSVVMINLWNLRTGDYVVPYSNGSVPTGGQMYETTFTVERVK